MRFYMVGKQKANDLYIYNADYGHFVLFMEDGPPEQITLFTALGEVEALAAELNKVDHIIFIRALDL